MQAVALQEAVFGDEGPKAANSHGGGGEEFGKGEGVRKRWEIRALSFWVKAKQQTATKNEQRKSTTKKKFLETIPKEFLPFFAASSAASGEKVS